MNEEDVLRALLTSEYGPTQAEIDIIMSDLRVRNQMNVSAALAQLQVMRKSWRETTPAAPKVEATTPAKTETKREPEVRATKAPAVPSVPQGGLQPKQNLSIMSNSHTIPGFDRRRA